MDYSKVYDNFITSRKGAAVNGYSEKHHILPRSMGGSDCSSNIIKLTAREHFFSHLLLAKIYGGKMWAALSFMSRSGTKSSKKYKCNSRQYQLAKVKDAEWKSKIYSGDSNPFYGKTHSQESISRMSKPRVNKENLYGRKCEGVGDVISFVRMYDPFPINYDYTVRDRIDAFFETSDSLKKLTIKYRRSESLKNASKNRNYFGHKNPNFGNGQAISGDKNPMFGKEHDESTKKKIGEKAKRKLECPYCSNISNIANAHRWHFDNCKNK
tara:strand:- start:2313 stop:3116 length:804 start_codon:yes stop_codon:yes gene_type:complete